MENKKTSGAEKELEALQKEYADFLYTVSHDLSAPIRHISSFSSIILDEHRDKFDEKTKTYFDFIIAGANDLNAMLNGLLQLSRLNTSRQPAIETDLGDVVDAIVRNTLYAEIEDSGARVDWEMLPAIVADPVQIKLLFTCLLSNSLKFVSQGVVPHIEITASEVSDHWEIRLADNGIGIEPEQCERVFEVFSRAVEKSSYVGCGVGLTIARKIVERHAGSIEIMPGRAQGAEVVLTLAKQSS